MLHEGVIQKTATAQANLSEGIDKEKEFRLVAEVSNSKTDAHYHIIMPEFVENMADTMKSNKTPFLLDHDIHQKVGKSIDGYTVGEDMNMSAMGVFRIPRDWNLKVDTNEFIKGVENETLDAVSVGIRAKKVNCNICEKKAPTSIVDVFFGDPKKVCLEHRPGREYDKKVAKWLIHSGSLGEVSSVYAGANYSAEIIDYTKMFLSQTDVYKDMTDDDFENIMPFMPEFSEMAKASPVIKSEKGFSFPSFFNQKPQTITGGNDMDFEKELAKICGQASTFVKDLPDDPIKAVQKIVDEYQEVMSQKSEDAAKLAAAEAKAKKFDDYYDARIQKAIEYGVIAEGDDFDKETWEEILKGYNKLSLVDKQMSKWMEDADEELPEMHGRQTTDDPPVRKKKEEEKDAWEQESDWSDYV